MRNDMEAGIASWFAMVCLRLPTVTKRPNKSRALYPDLLLSRPVSGVYNYFNFLFSNCRSEGGAALLKVVE